MKLPLSTKSYLKTMQAQVEEEIGGEKNVFLLRKKVETIKQCKLPATTDFSLKESVGRSLTKLANPSASLPLRARPVLHR